jgi:diguanylate cyclase (GGDEF)-like protein
MVLLIRAYVHNQKIQHLAEHDKLTSLPNRLLFEDRMKQALALAKRNNKKFALAYVDIDHFKTINDTLGHDFGDMLLKETARRMVSCIREVDTVSRIGGDEFLILLYDIENKESALHIAGKILHKINQDVSFSGQILKTSASIGISIYPEHGQTIATLEKSADIAMYMAKKDGRNQARLYISV